MIALGEAIRAARDSLGLSLPAVADKASLDPESLARYEGGEHHIPGDVLWRLSDVLGVPFEELDSTAELQRHLKSLSVRFKADNPYVSESVRLAVARAANAGRQAMELEALAGLPDR